MTDPEWRPRTWASCPPSNAPTAGTMLRSRPWGTMSVRPLILVSVIASWILFLTPRSVVLMLLLPASPQCAHSISPSLRGARVSRPTDRGHGGKVWPGSSSAHRSVKSQYVSTSAIDFGFGRWMLTKYQTAHSSSRMYRRRRAATDRIYLRPCRPAMRLDPQCTHRPMTIP